MAKLQIYFLSVRTLLTFILLLLLAFLFFCVNAHDNSESGTILLDRGQSFLDFGDCNHVINYRFKVLEPGVIRDLSGENSGLDDAWGNEITVTFYIVPGRYAPKDQYLNNIRDSIITGRVSTRHISFGLPYYEDSPFFIQPVLISYEINDLGKDCNMDGMPDNNTLGGTEINGKNSDLVRGFFERELSSLYIILVYYGVCNWCSNIYGC